MATSDIEPKKPVKWLYENAAAVLFLTAWLLVHLASKASVADTASGLVLIVCQISLAAAWMFWKSKSTVSDMRSSALNALVFSGLIATFGLNASQRISAYSNPFLFAFELSLLMLFLAGAAGRLTSAVKNSPSGTAFYEAIAVELIPQKLRTLGSLEIKAMHIAIFSWRDRKYIPENSISFSNYISISPMLYAFLFLSTIESIIFHYFATHFMAKFLAIPLIMVGDFFIIYALGLAKSLKTHPTYIQNDTLRLRVGILMDLSLQRSDIHSVTGVTVSDEFRVEGCIKASLLAYPNIILTLTRPIPNPLPFKIRATVTAIALKFDDAENFSRAVKSWAGAEDRVFTPEALSVAEAAYSQ